ncbi:hypothetical protein LBMAG42_16280 [Deltaproteobacteria bacterium]|nr:hypothetical protein LBMAG42_16280 [Deltaproteobacteria bacterium]
MASAVDIADRVKCKMQPSFPLGDRRWTTPGVLLLAVACRATGPSERPVPGFDPSASEVGHDSGRGGGDDSGETDSADRDTAFGEDSDADETGVPGDPADDPFACSGLVGENHDTVPAWSGLCEGAAGFTSHGSSCYWPSKADYSWVDARATCRSAGGFLATVSDEDEGVFLFGLVAHAHLGACDGGAEGQWVWITGEAVAETKWAGGEPNDTNGGEDCLEQLPSGAWNDAGCSDVYGVGFVCEFG